MNIHQLLRAADYRKVKPEDYHAVTDEQMEAYRQNAVEVEQHNRGVNEQLSKRWKSAKGEIVAIFGEESKVAKYLERVGKSEWVISSYSLWITDGFKEFERKCKKSREDRARERNTKEQEQRRQVALVEMIRKTTVLALKYGFPAETDGSTLFEKLRERNRYFDLALAGQETRGDWSEGYYRVADALDRFRVSASERDGEIIAEYEEILSDDGDRDGRVFRDCEFNYNLLFDLARNEVGDMVDDVMWLYDAYGAP